MPRRIRSSLGQQTIDLALRRASQGWLGFNVESTDPIVEIIRGARLREQIKLRKHEMISWEEKQRAFGKINYAPTPKFTEIHQDRHRFRHVMAGRRSGKTSGATAEAAAVMLEKPGSLGWVIGPTFDLAQRAWDMLLKYLEAAERRGYTKLKRPPGSQSQDAIMCEHNGAIAELHSAVQGDLLQGAGLDWALLDEIAQYDIFVWEECILPALADKRGWALLIGTPLGESWVSRRVRTDHAESEAKSIEPQWREWVYETWHNIYEFPGGRNDLGIIAMEREMDPLMFQQHVCARPQRNPFVVYREFNQDVHVKRCAFKPNMPVYLSVDPSSSVDPYAVAVIQDYGNLILLIDEFYRIGMTALDVVNELRERKWWGNVQECIIDDAAPHERLFWKKHPDVHFPVKMAKKPSYIEDSFGYVRNWFREPLLYNTLTREKRDEIVQELQPGEEWSTITPEDQRRVLARLEDHLRENPAVLEQCAKFFIDPSCRNTIDELLGYVYKKPRKDDHNVSETPRDYKNHMMDACRYFIWHYHRRDGRGYSIPERYAEVA